MGSAGDAGGTCGLDRFIRKGRLSMVRYRIASVVSANGTGHFRRSIGILHRLAIMHPSSIELTVFCTDRQLAAMQSWRRLRHLVGLGARFCTDFECGPRWPSVSVDKSMLAWRDRLAEAVDFLSADLVVSDNLVNVLSLRHDAVLAGSFLWSDVLNSESHPNVQEFVADELGCLRTHRPPMLCVGAIATRTVLSETRAVQLAWMCEEMAVEPRTLIRLPRIGICGGTTDAAATEVVRLAEILAPYFEVTVDSSVESAPLPSGVRRGLLRDVPLTDVDIMLCRPGAGTVMDCVAANMPFLTFHEPKSPEMEYNANRLAESGIADNLTHPLVGERIVVAVNRMATPSVYHAASARLHEEPKNGLDQAANWLSGRLAS